MTIFLGGKGGQSILLPTIEYMYVHVVINVFFVRRFSHANDILSELRLSRSDKFCKQGCLDTCIYMYSLLLLLGSLHYPQHKSPTNTE